MKFSHKTYEKRIDLVRERPALYNYQLTRVQGPPAAKEHLEKYC